MKTTMPLDENWKDEIVAAFVYLFLIRIRYQVMAVQLKALLGLRQAQGLPMNVKSCGDQHVLVVNELNVDVSVKDVQ